LYRAGRACEPREAERTELQSAACEVFADAEGAPRVERIFRFKTVGWQRFTGYLFVRLDLKDERRIELLRAPQAVRAWFGRCGDERIAQAIPDVSIREHDDRAAIRHASSIPVQRLVAV